MYILIESFNHFAKTHTKKDGLKFRLHILWHINYRIAVIFSGAPEAIRTPDPNLRRVVLYPSELRARGALNEGRTHTRCRTSS